jgi:pectate lyase
MREPARYTRRGLFLLGITLLLWVAALLFRFRIINIFDAYLMKFPGPVVIFGAMAAFPLATIYVGMKMIRARQIPRLGWVFAVAGGFLSVAFAAVIGLPMLIDAMTPGPPMNPTTPRPVEPQLGLPVFPGAEGFGTRTIAGRGGKLIEVTSLANDGPGTLRAALDDPSPRIIVFRVAGTIELKESLFVNHPYVTVAGQTAPGDGIIIKNAGVVITTHDVLIQHLRVRPGNEGDVEPDDNDAISILGRHADLDGAFNVVLDHISASWGEDETISTWYGAHDITISWSIISEALNRSRHRKETHSAGLLIGDSSYHVSVHHTLLAHNDFRNPLISGGGTHDFVNNVIYNWGILPAEVLDFDSNTFLNFVGNYFIPGPSTQSGPFEILFAEGNPRIYVEGNLGPHRPDPGMDEWALVGFGYGEQGVAPETYRSQTRFATHPVTAASASRALENVLAEAGATAPQRDSVDLRVVNEVTEGSGSIIDSPYEVGGYPELANGTPASDSDHDGMPDDWEREMGLDPEDASDGNGDLDGDGYTNIEEYLHLLSSGG